MFLCKTSEGNDKVQTQLLSRICVFSYAGVGPFLNGFEREISLESQELDTS